jgi:ribonuclease VapC
MIAVDTSALMAIALNEPEREVFCDIIGNAEHAFVSSATIIEAHIVTHGRGGIRLTQHLDELVDALGLEIIPVGHEHIECAHAAFVIYGKGSGHPAQLNFGDLFSYALAKSHGVPLLFKGKDFSQTDIGCASAPPPT